MNPSTSDPTADRRRRPLGVRVAAIWPAVLLAVLSAIYLTFGIVAGGLGAVLGVGGVVAVVAAWALRSRSRAVGFTVLVAGVVPFAVMAAWTVVIPVTALLLVAIGVPVMRARAANRQPTHRARESSRLVR